MIFDHFSDAELQSRVDGLVVDQETRALLDEITKRWLDATDRAGMVEKIDYDFAHHEDDGHKGLFR